jgi:hypothetical protein
MAVVTGACALYLLTRVPEPVPAADEEPVATPSAEHLAAGTVPEPEREPAAAGQEALRR